MRLLTWVIGACRAIISMLSTDRSRTGVIERMLRGILLVPIFGFMLALLRARALIFGPLRIEAVTRDGDRVCCHLPDLIQMYLYLFGVWEPDLAAYIRSRLRPGDVFVDVGANIGFDTLIASRAVQAGGEVIAIEASPTVFDRLRETLRLNGSPTNVRVMNKAAGATRGTLSIYSGPQHNVGLTTTVQRGSMPRVAEVEALSLGELVPSALWERVRLIKIDVEGGEDSVLAGMHDDLHRLPEHAEIAVELSPAWWSDRSRTALDVLRLFIEAGYRVYVIPNNYWPWRYLWPNDVKRPRRMRDERMLAKPMKRLDVILSREDAEWL